MFRNDRLLLKALGAALLFVAVPGSGQQAAQAPDPAGTSQPAFTLRTSTNLVVEDVVVTDANGHPVHGLSARDFVLTEDGHPQRVRNFAEHTASSAPSRPAAATSPALAAGIFTNYTHSPAGNGPANVLLLDMLNTPLRDQQYARQQILQFLDHAPAGTEIAIFGLGSKLTLLQGFTADPSILKAALRNKRSTSPSGLLNDSLGGGGSGNTSETGISDALSDSAHTPDNQEAVANAQQFEAESQTFQLDQRSQRTLDALNQVARYLANIPGRKNLIWFSGSFPINLLPDTSTANGFASMSSHEAEFRETTSMLARSQVALYPVDARGLQTTGTFNAASQSTRYATDAQALGKDLQKFDAQVSSENSSMLAAARETGGQAFINTNGLTAAVATAIENGANYYTLTYTPSVAGSDDEYRKIHVELQGKPFALSYRQGYYPVAPSNSAPRKASSSAATDASRSNEAVAARSLITRSMMRGAPAPTQIQFTVRVRPATGLAEAAVAPGNEVQAAGKQTAGPFLRLAVDYAVDQHELSLTQVDGTFRGDFEFLIFVYDIDGTLLNRTGSTLHAAFQPAVFQDFLRRPFSFNQDISVPLRGELFLRLAVHDLNTGHIGAVEIPVDSVRTLPALALSK